MKRARALLVLLVLCTSLGTSLRVHAETPQERQIRIAALAAELEQKRAALRDLDNQQRSVTSSLGELDETLSKLADEQELANKALRQSRRELQALEKQVGIDEATLRDVQARLEKRLRVLYVDGEGGVLRALLGAESFEELSIRRRAVQTLAQNDATLTSEVARAAVLVRERKARAVLVQDEAAFTSRQIDDQRALILQARSEREAAITRIVGEKTLGTGPKPVNFVFHGGSGSTREEIREAIGYGAIKMNLDTDLQWAFWDGIRAYEAKNHDYLQGQIGNPKGDDAPNKKYYDPRIWIGAAEDAFTKRLISSFEDLNCVNRLA